jgi:hypothetical protein
MAPGENVRAYFQRLDDRIEQLTRMGSPFSTDVLVVLVSNTLPPELRATVAQTVMMKDKIPSWPELKAMVFKTVQFLQGMTSAPVGNMTSAVLTATQRESVARLTAL